MKTTMRYPCLAIGSMPNFTVWIIGQTKPLKELNTWAGEVCNEQEIDPETAELMIQRYLQTGFNLPVKLTDIPEGAALLFAVYQSRAYVMVKTSNAKYFQYQLNNIRTSTTNVNPMRIYARIPA